MIIRRSVETAARRQRRAAGCYPVAPGRHWRATRGSVGRGSARAEMRDVTEGQSGASVPRLGRSLALPSLARWPPRRSGTTHQTEKADHPISSTAGSPQG